MDFLLHSIRNILHTPKHSPTLFKICYFFCSHPFWRPLECLILFFFGRVSEGALILPILVLESARTTDGPAEHFIHQEQCGNCSKI